LRPPRGEVGQIKLLTLFDRQQQIDQISLVGLSPFVSLTLRTY